MIRCPRTMRVPENQREQILKWITDNGELRHEHGILAEAVLAGSTVRVVRPTGRSRCVSPDNLGYDDVRVDAVRQAAKLMAAAAITAPKSGGQLFLAGKHNFMETVVVADADERHRISRAHF